MKLHGRRLPALVLAVFMVLALTGCMTASVEELYSLPQLSEQYVQLQELIAQQIDAGSAYAAPIGGSNRQSIQLRDLDGDGTAEALAFLADADRTPTVCVYRQDGEGNFSHSYVIRGRGTAVASVDYADLTGDGAAELIIAWTSGGNLRELSVYALSNSASAGQIQFPSADCSEFVLCDLDGDGVEDLLNLRINPGAGSTVEMYIFDGEGSQVTGVTALLSGGVTAVRRAVAGSLSDGTPALFVESDLGDQGMVTDVITTDGERLTNITMSALGRSNTLRPDGLFAADLNGDGALEIPAGETEFLTWHSLNAHGDMTPAVSTFFDADDGWYFVLPDDVRTSDLTVERHGAGGDEPAVVFSLTGDESAPERSVLVIYTLTGDNRLDRAEVDGRIILRQDEDAVYAARLLTDELRPEDIQGRFYILYDQWQTGDL